MKKRIFGAALVSLLVGFYIGNSLVEKEVTPQTLLKELKVLIHQAEEDAKESVCLDCDKDGFKESQIDIGDTSGGETILDVQGFDIDAGSLDD